MVILLLAFLASVSVGLVGQRDRFADPVFAKKLGQRTCPSDPTNNSVCNNIVYNDIVYNDIVSRFYRCKDSDFFANGNVFR